MGIQINGQTDIISAIDGGLDITGATLNVSGILTASSFSGGIITATNANITTLSGTGIAYTNAQISNLNVAGIVTSTNGFNAVNVPFFRNTPTISTDYTITTTYNEMSIGPIAVQTGVTVTVNLGATWTVV